MRTLVQLLTERGRPRPLVPEVRTHMLEQSGVPTVHEVTGLVLDADARRIQARATLRERAPKPEPIDKEIDSLYPSPDGRSLSAILSPGVASGFTFVAGRYQTVV